MEREIVESTNVASIGYDPATSTLEVAFNSGSVYQYSDVPADVFTKFLSAESKGKFLNSVIKSEYDAHKV